MQLLFELQGATRGDLLILKSAKCLREDENAQRPCCPLWTTVTCLGTSSFSPSKIPQHKRVIPYKAETTSFFFCDVICVFWKCFFFFLKILEPGLSLRFPRSQATCGGKDTTVFSHVLHVGALKMIYACAHDLILVGDQSKHSISSSGWLVVGYCTNLQGFLGLVLEARCRIRVYHFSLKKDHLFVRSISAFNRDGLV